MQTHTLPSRDEMIRAFLGSDASYDGLFYTGVRTTGIFCRPSCTAKKPRPENVEFYGSAREALFAGFRPCKRCVPLEVPGAPPQWVAKLMAHVEETPDVRLTASDLREIGIDPDRARRYFMEHYRMTFTAYVRSRRLGGALASIRNGGSIDDAVFDSGYSSHSGFREAFTRTFGITPGRSAQLDDVRLSWVESPLGPLVIGANNDGVCLLEFTDRRMLETELETIKRRLKATLIPGENDHTAQLKAELGEYFAGRRKTFDVALTYPGTPFQQLVWNELLRVPYGETRSYEEIASRIGARNAVRAVGRANGMNRIAIVIPCHRVIGKNGEPVGYGGGLWRKRWLLEHEAGAAC